MENEFVLVMENIRKEFPGVVALDNVELKVRKGTVNSLMGENGAGKSTLMKILIGMHQPDLGTITFKNEKIQISSTQYALNKGISMIHQELSPVPYMSVAENMFLGREPVSGAFKLVDHKKMYEDTKKLLERLEINIDPDTKMKDLSIANTQMIEIAKAISYNSDLIIMDEPTSAITEKEVQHLFKIINQLKENGVSIIYITHKMDEVFTISDDITVFRDGKFIGCDKAKNLNNNKLVEMMVGRELKQVFHKEEAEIGDVILSVKNITKKGKFKDVSFDVKKGEILGIAGLMGAGRTEVMESVFGITKIDSGEIFVKGKKVEINSPSDAIKNKMALLTEDRKLTGLYLMLSVKDNMAIANIDEYIEGIFVNQKKIEEDCLNQIDIMQIKTPSMEQTIKNLSGGNQQKVLISRWLLTNPDILILDEPTRGIDIGAKAEIHKLMSKLAKQGKAIIMISSELPEVLGMSDRIIVMHEGRLSGIIDREDASQEAILNLATGTSSKNSASI